MNSTVIFSCGNDFSAGTLENLQPAPHIGRGALMLADGAREGSFVSPVVTMEDFSTAVMSWNTDVPAGTHSEAYCRVCDQEGQWSEWLSWGVWGPFVKRASLNDTDGGCASVETDTLSMKKDHVGKAVQLKCVLRREEGAADPVLRLLAVTTRLSKADRLVNQEPKCSIDNKAPAYCQMIRDPNMGSVMCSATTATVQMNSMGDDILPEEAALACWDHVYEGYGNWSFTMAMAGSFGYETWLAFANADQLRAELKKGHPIGVNAAYSNTHERATERAPFVENTPGYTPGHLLTARGLEVDSEGREWLLVNDSYGNPDSQAIRRYPMDQFIHAWSGIMYVVRPKLAGAGSGSPYRVAAKLQKTDFGDEFRLVVNGEELPLDPHFNGKRKCCTGVVAYTVDDPYVYATTANRPFHYTKVTVNGNVFIPAKDILRLNPLGDKAAIHVYIINDRGVTYTADLHMSDL